MIAPHFVDVDASAHGRAARLAVHVAGKGPLAVLVHGYPLDHRMWLDTLHGPLAQHRTLVAIDLRGHGESPSSGDAVHSMELLAHDVAAVIRSLSDGPADVVGLSMGGYVVFALWAAEPQLVRSLVLTNTRAVADTEAVRAGRDASMLTVIEQGRRAVVEGMLPKLLAPTADPMLRARVITMAENLPVESILADARGLKVRPERVSMLATITVPTLVITGELDTIAPVAEAQAMADAIPGARFVCLRGCGHLAPMEAPAAFASAVRGFWAR